MKNHKSQKVETQTRCEEKCCKNSTMEEKVKCRLCHKSKEVGNPTDVELLLKLAREELKWHNDRAVNIINRSTFWLGLIVAATATMAKTPLLNQVVRVDTFYTPFLLSGFAALGFAAWFFWKVVGLINVSAVDTNAFTKFISEYLKGENIYCPQCFSIDEFLSRFLPDSETILESAEKEADKRAKDYGRGMLALIWSAGLLLVGFISKLIIGS